MRRAVHDLAHFKLLRHPLSGSPLVVYGNVNDISVFGQLADPLSIWEPHIYLLLRRLVRPDFVCLDIGANIGCHALVLGALASEGHVYAFEPVPSTFHLLRASLERNGMKNITALQLGAGSRREVRKVCEFEVWSGNCFICDEKEAEPQERLRQVIHDLVKTKPEKDYISRVEIESRLVDVEMVPLDEWYAAVGLQKVDFIKLDVEGFEPAVLDGARRLIERFLPSLLTEINPSCLQRYFDLSDRSYFEMLQGMYPFIYVVDDAGHEGFSLEVCEKYEDLEKWYEKRGWQELLCTCHEIFDGQLR